jgi:type II secretion system protein N
VKELWLKYARYAKIAAYPLFYLVCLAIFVSLTFPYDKLKEHLVVAFNTQQSATGGQQELQIEEMTGYWLSGVRMRGVKLITASSEPGMPPQKIEVDEATARYSMLSPLVGKSDMSFDVHAFGGEASGSFGADGKDQSIEVAIDDVDIGHVEPLVRALGVPLQGKLGGTMKFALPEGKASKGTGSVALEVKNAVVGDGKAKLKGALALPPINVGLITLNGEAKDGTVKLTKLVSGGKDLELQGDGRIALREIATDALCDLLVRFKVNDAYRGKSDVTKTIFGDPATGASGLLEMAEPRMKQSKRADGFYAWTVRGPLGRPEVAPSASP